MLMNSGVAVCCARVKKRHKGKFVLRLLSMVADVYHTWNKSSKFYISFAYILVHFKQMLNPSVMPSPVKKWLL